MPTLSLVSYPEGEQRLLVKHIRRLAVPGEPLSILEAGCGAAWQLQLQGVRYVLTGVDVNQDALIIRQRDRGDLDVGILGDLRTVSLEDERYDAIYNSFVLEHIENAQRVLDNFSRWLKPGGILILRIPDRHSVYGFLSRVTPFWIHVFYKRYIGGSKTAGKPGHDPFPTIYDAIVSREGIRRWCAARGMTIKEEFGWNYPLARPGVASFAAKSVIHALRVLSLGRLAGNHINLTYVIEKAVEKPMGKTVPLAPSQGLVHDEIGTRSDVCT
jgi:SAM-dependent methyltransferase